MLAISVFHNPSLANEVKTGPATRSHHHRQSTYSVNLFFATAAECSQVGQHYQLLREQARNPSAAIQLPVFSNRKGTKLSALPQAIRHSPWFFLGFQATS